jgi:hypothetical protein
VTTVTRKGGITSRGHPNHRSRSHRENFGLNLGLHDLAPFSPVSNQSWAIKGAISNIDLR